ncbi:NAD(P)-binding protein [Backusella circina FSU 941]|nr:NAD(P)-binding protein [Backusella circina FSU 941]
MSANPTIPEFSLKGKKAIVTGGARGLGLEMSKALAESGADVAMMYVHNDQAQELAAQISKENNVVCKAYQADISDHDAVTKAIDDIHKDFGRIDIFIANAGISIGGAIETYDVKDWHKQFDVNVHGVFYSVQAVAKYMLEQGKGSIILTSSISAAVANRPQFQCGYNTTKSAVSMMAKAMAFEWARRGVRVNCINPGYMRTEMLDKVMSSNPDLEKAWTDLTPMGRVGEAKEVRGAAVFLASDASSYVTGTELFVDGGYTCV